MHITEKTLETAGYKKFTTTNNVIAPNSKFGIQKCIYGADDKKAYFITLYFYDYKTFNNVEAPCGWSSNVQFYINNKDDNRTFNVEYFIQNNTTIKEMEDFYAKIFKSMNCIGYDEQEY